MAWDLLVQDWGTQNWSKGGQGTAEISPAGQLHLLRNTNTTDSVYVFNDLGTLPDDYTVEFKACMDDYKNGGLLAHQFYDGTHRCMIQIFVDKVYNPDSTTSIACTNTAGVWYTWRILIDSSSHIMKVYRNGVYLGDLGGGLNYTSGDGTVYVECGTSASISCELHEDYLYVGTGLFASIARTVVEKLGGVDVVTKFKGAIHLSTEILGGVDYVSRVLGLTIVVTDEDLSTHSGFEYDEVTYTATVLDSHGNPLPSNFLVSLEYKEIETHLVLNQPLDDSVYNQVTGLLTLIWHVPSEDPEEPNSYTIVLEWSTQEI